MPSRKASIPSMFLITPIQAAAVIAGNCLFGKVYITLRWRWFGANKILGNLWKKAFVLPNTNPIKELQDGHLKQDPQFKIDRATQLNESEWTALCLPLCFYFASSAVGADAGTACSMMAWGQVGYTLARPTIGYPFQLPFAIMRYIGVALSMKPLFAAAF